MDFLVLELEFLGGSVIGLSESISIYDRDWGYILISDLYVSQLTCALYASK